MAARKEKEREELHARLRDVRADPTTHAAASTLEQALLHEHWLVVTEAAEIVGARELHAFEPILKGVFARFVEHGAKRDPGCRAKLAALVALDRLECFDPEPFLPAVRYVQLEPARGGGLDTAGGVRARALFALFRLRHPDAPLFAGELLADADAGVRSSVVQALAYHDDRAAAGLLVYKLRAGDDDPNVLSDAASALLGVAPDFALPLLSAWLASENEVERECAALSLGQSRRPEAVKRLIEWLAEAGFDRDQALGVRALGASRLPEARRYLLELVVEGGVTLARSAVEALSLHAYDGELKRAVLEAARRSRVPKLMALAEERFAGSG